MPPFSLSLTRNRHLQFHLQQGNKHQQLNLQENLFTYQHTYTHTNTHLQNMQTPTFTLTYIH